MTKFEKQPERISDIVGAAVERAKSRTGDPTERAQLILLDFVMHMAKKSYYFARLRGIASDLAKEGATYTISEQKSYCGKKNCKKCPHGTHYTVFFRVQQRQSSKYLGKPLW
jgi:hypothetical protein